MKIGFAKNLVPIIKDGTKTLTYRLGNKYNTLKIGDKVFCYDSTTNKDFAELEIVNVTKSTFIDLLIDRPGHEEYESKNHMRSVFEEYYGEVKDDDEVIVIEYKVIKLI